MAQVITPRWEWRTFGRRFGNAEAAFRAMTPDRVHESDEIYLLGGRDVVKVRDGLMDIKQLQEVDRAGLERWSPVMKAAFPLSGADVLRVLGALAIGTPPIRSDAYDLRAFIDEIAGPGGPIRHVPVHKRRTRYTIDGCTSELTDVTVGGLATRTVAIESEDPEAVVAAVRRIGLGGYTNVSYPRGLTALIDASPPRFAVIDVGTNSVKFHVGERGPDGAWRTVVDRAEVTRIGEGLAATGRIGDVPLERTLSAIEAMVAEARANDVLAIAAVGTAGPRMSENRADVVTAIETRCGIPFELIDGDEEARLAFLAVERSLGLPPGDLVVFDTGGGSSQFTFGRGGTVDERFSVNVGAARYTERFGLDAAVGQEVVDEALAAIDQDLSRLDGRPMPDALVGMGGAMTNMTAVMLAMSVYDPERVQGATLHRDEVDRQIGLYRSMDARSRRSVVGLQPERAEVILAGACIVRSVMGRLGRDRLTVSDRGLRRGLIAERFGVDRAG